MRICLTLVCILFITGIGFAQKKGNPNGKFALFKEDSIFVKETPQPDTLPLLQTDGRTIHILGVDTKLCQYSETIDGYTIVMNKNGIYEYADNNNDGNLVNSGTESNDPKKREKKEIKYVSKLKKHLRYENLTLIMMIEKQKRTFAKPLIVPRPGEWKARSKKK